MSGGHFDYIDGSLQSQIFGWDTETTEEAMKLNPLQDKELSGMVFEMLNLLHDFDWYVSGDTSKTTFSKNLMEFKNKWLNSTTEDRIKYIVDSSLNSVKEDLYNTFQISLE